MPEFDYAAEYRQTHRRYITPEEQAAYRAAVAIVGARRALVPEPTPEKAAEIEAQLPDVARRLVATRYRMQLSQLGVAGEVGHDLTRRDMARLERGLMPDAVLSYWDALLAWLKKNG